MDGNICWSEDNSGILHSFLTSLHTHTHTHTSSRLYKFPPGGGGDGGGGGGVCVCVLCVCVCVVCVWCVSSCHSTANLLCKLSVYLLHGRLFSAQSHYVFMYPSTDLGPTVFMSLFSLDNRV